MGTINSLVAAIAGCSLLGCSATPMTATPPNASGSPSTLPSRTPATSGQSEPSTYRDGPTGREQQTDGCRADAQSSRWLSQGPSPISGWWEEFSRRHPGRTTPVTTGGWAPIVDLQIHGLDASSRVFFVPHEAGGLDGPALDADTARSVPARGARRRLIAGPTPAVSCKTGP